MTTVVVIQGIVILALLVLVFAERREHDKQHSAKNESYQTLINEMDQRHVAERRELLTRIQHPHLVPQPAGRRREQRPTDQKELAKVGTISPPKDPEN